MSDFISEAINEDLQSGRFTKIHTRFPPEPNGYLHIGHAKAICIDFGLAEKFGGKTNLRFDDTNPVREDVEFVDAIKDDIHWLGFDWEERLYYASDYFDQIFEYAVTLIRKGKAFVCDLSSDQIREYRGTLTEPGKESPFRNRTVDENLDLFLRMRNGEFAEGTKTLRAKIDMASPNINLRDPVMYRIINTPHHRTGTKWSIYPMYDFAHGQSDSIEGITHSLCSLEYEDHRPLYDWYIKELGIFHTRQIEFARLNLTYTVMSKRKLMKLVESGVVSGWDDPRMPTLAGMRRRGYTAESIKNFCDRIGVAKRDSTVDFAFLEHCVREVLNRDSARMFAVLRPLKVVITNYPENYTEEFDAINNPENPTDGTRKVPFSRVLYIEQDDFREAPPPKYYRLSPGKEVRLRYAYFIKCNEVIKDGNGNIIEIRCTYDPATKGGESPDGRKVKSTIHWVSAQHAASAEVRLYSVLFSKPNPEDVAEGGDFIDNINQNSIETVKECKIEPLLSKVKPGTKVQFERIGYFCADTVDSKEGAPVFNRIVTLKDTWAKIEKMG